MIKRLIRRHAPHDAGADERDTLEVRVVLAALDRVPRRELPDGPARAALVEAIRSGRIYHVYRPMAADYYVIAWNDRPAWVDPRQRLSDFLRETQAQQGGEA